MTPEQERAITYLREFSPENASKLVALIEACAANGEAPPQINIVPTTERALALLRDLWPEKAAEYEAALIASAGDKSGIDAPKLKINIHYKLEKFEGDYSPDKKPFDVIEGEDSIGG